RRDSLRHVSSAQLHRSAHSAGPGAGPPQGQNLEPCRSSLHGNRCQSQTSQENGSFLRTKTLIAGQPGNLRAFNIYLLAQCTISVSFIFSHTPTGGSLNWAKTWFPSGSFSPREWENTKSA